MMQVKLDITDGSQKNGEECCSHIARKLSLKNNTGQVGEECGKPGCQRRLKKPRDWAQRTGSKKHCVNWNGHNKLYTMMRIETKTFPGVIQNQIRPLFIR